MLPLMCGSCRLIHKTDIKRAVQLFFALSSYRALHLNTYFVDCMVFSETVKRAVTELQTNIMFTRPISVIFFFTKFQFRLERIY